MRLNASKGYEESGDPVIGIREGRGLSRDLTQRLKPGAFASIGTARLRFAQVVP